MYIYITLYIFESYNVITTKNLLKNKIDKFHFHYTIISNLLYCNKENIFKMQTRNNIISKIFWLKII